MTNRRLAASLSMAILLAAPALCQRTVARLSRETRGDVVRVDTTTNARSFTSPKPLRDSALSRSAAEAFFAKSDLGRARVLSGRALRNNPQDAEALFVRMELAAVENDHAGLLDAALRLCEVGADTPADVRVQLAAMWVRESAANTPEFLPAIPRLAALLFHSRGMALDLRLALLNAAMDGAPGLDAYAISRAAGIVGDWRMVGPLGSQPLADFDGELIPHTEDLAEDWYGNRAVENFQFPDSWVRLPDYMSRRGVFYAAGRFAGLTTSSWRVRVESAGPAELYVDGQPVLRKDTSGREEATIKELTPGPHRLLLKFTGSAAPLRVMVSAEAPPARPPLRAGLSWQEESYLLAAEHLIAGEVPSAIQQIDAVGSVPSPLALQFLLAQCWRTYAPDSEQYAEASQAFEAAFSARGGIVRNNSNAGAVPQKLDGGPESLSYAQSLSRDGDHEQAARALEKLLAAAPLNRAARHMLVRELQLAGDDLAAQRAAVEWLHVAPNAESYHRLAAAASQSEPSAASSGEFFRLYRRDATEVARETPIVPSTASAIVLLDDHVAISRADGSVSSYAHTAKRRLAAGSVDAFSLVGVPTGAQVLQYRILRANGTVTELPHDARSLPDAASTISTGDTLDAEYVLHFAGDGGIPEHAEVFQFVFGNFEEPVLSAHFVVLTAADRGDGGVVIATGDAPQCSSTMRDGMLERVWERDGAPQEIVNGSPLPALGIVRVVEQENGWSVPRDAERKRRIETIHPGPRSEDS